MTALIERTDRPAAKDLPGAGVMRIASWFTGTLMTGLLLLAGGVWLLGPSGDQPADIEATGALPRDEERLTWQGIAKPLQAYSFDIPDAPRDLRRYEGRRHAIGQGREDIVTVGAFEVAAPYARIALYRPGQEAGEPGSLFLDVARRAASAGLAVERSAAPGAMPTKFGPFEVSDVTLGGPRGSRACLAFRYVAAEPDFRITGWSCGTAGRPIDRIQLSCQLDRLTLVAGADDKALRALFLKAERQRSAACTTSPLAAAGKRGGWLDPEAAAPSLREAKFTR
jgi:hypothetical protein